MTEGGVFLSDQSEKTLRVYQNWTTALYYIANSLTYRDRNPGEAERQYGRVYRFIKEGLSALPAEAIILDVGSGDGRKAEGLTADGFSVIASDASEALIEVARGQGFEYAKFHILFDDFSDLPWEISGILCWGVFVHFTPNDLSKALQKTYEALKPGGCIVFNVFRCSDSRAKLEGGYGEWIDFPEPFHLGAPRFFYYYSESLLRKIIGSTKFRIVRLRKDKDEVGNDCYFVVLKKS